MPGTTATAAGTSHFARARALAVANPGAERNLANMRTPHHSSIAAVLGPTNTGKTHLAIERMCAHSSGMIGFPLRLLAREVYDRVVKIKGAAEVALITGEEKILPPRARWLLCTAESMPIGTGSREVSFVALDEAQLGADAERGHVFTDRLLHARGREETMILGSEALRPMIKALVPGAEIISRPRFSTLSYAGAHKISRLPKRSVIVAFSAEEVYAVAEMLRRVRGGAAVVMGALSPRTRNAQVAMFQAGEVDYLVATDAIGMGLNMDVSHVAFASLSKFDGHRQRRLTVAEMAQIAGRAGRHQRDGTFGALSAEGPGAFLAEEIAAIEEHHFPRLNQLYWREGAPSTDSVDALIADLELKPGHPALIAAPEAVDLAVLRKLAAEPWVRDRATSPAAVARLWAACGLPDFRKLGVDPHSRFIARLFGYLSENNGHIPHDWFAAEIARLDNVSGDVETIAGRIAGARSWAYIAQRADWLADPAHWAGRAAELEERLSDALHERLTQRFVDRRTTMLMRQLGAGAAAMPVEIDADGAVSVDGEPIGHLRGFAFFVAADATAADRRLLLSAAEKRLVAERCRRAEALAAAADAAFALVSSPGEVPGIAWQGVIVATLGAGPTLMRPRLMPDRALDTLPAPARAAVCARLAAFFATQSARHLSALLAAEALSREAKVAPATRAVAAALLEGAGITARLPLAEVLETLSADDRKMLRRAGFVIGALDIFDTRLLKAQPAAWRRALIAARGGHAVVVAPLASAAVLASTASGATPANGFRIIDKQAVRVDLVERLARALHDARRGKAPFTPDTALATSMGISSATLAKLMRQLGFRPRLAADGAAGWVWQGRAPRPKAAGPVRDNGFAALAALKLGHG